MQFTPPEEYDAAMAYYGYLDRQMTRLRAQLMQHPDPRDPEHDETLREQIRDLEEGAA